MKKRILCLVCLVLASLCLLTACVKSPQSVMSKDIRQAPDTFGKASAPVTVKGIAGDLNEDFIVTIEQPDAKEPKYIGRVYSLSAGKVVYEDSKAVVNPEILLLGYGMFAVKTSADSTVAEAVADAVSDTAVTEWTVFNEKGKEVRKFVGAIMDEHELLYAEHSVFEMTEGKIKSTDIRWNEGAALADRFGDYRFTCSSNGCDVYDLGGNLLSSYRFPDYANETRRFCGMLNNGNVLIQFTETVGKREDGLSDKEYTYTDGTNMYKLTTAVMNPETGKLRTVNLKQIVEQVSPNVRAGGQMASGTQNVAILTPIQANKRVSFSTMDTMFVVMDNNGGISEIEKLHPAQSFLPGPVGKNAWMLNCVDGKQILVNKSGKLLGTIKSTKIGYDYYVTDYAIFNMSGKLTYDLTAEKRTVTEAEALYALLKDTKGNTYIYTDGKVIEFLINSKETVSKTESNLIFTDTMSGTDVVTTVYNHRGEKLVQMTGKAARTVKGEKATFLLGIDLTKQETEVYKLTKK